MTQSHFCQKATQAGVWNGHACQPLILPCRRAFHSQQRVVIPGVYFTENFLSYQNSFERKSACNLYYLKIWWRIMALILMHWFTLSIKLLCNNTIEIIKLKLAGWSVCKFPQADRERRRPPGKPEMSLIKAAPLTLQNFLILWMAFSNRSCGFYWRIYGK